MFYRLNNNFARVNANSDLQIRIAEPSHPILHCERSQAAANSVILVRLRGTKYCHDPVALRLVDDALITNNRFVHHIENGLEASHAYFGIAQTVDQAG
jgi:hypothetical protein